MASSLQPITTALKMRSPLSYSAIVPIAIAQNIAKLAPKLNAMGYSCLAIDQRSGMNIFGEINETSSLAKLKKLPTGYLDAKPDIEAAVDYAYKVNNSEPIILLGSSYSASLGLWIATNSEKIEAVLAFSPSEYLKGVSLAEEIRIWNKPVFVTSAKKEIDQVSKPFKLADPKYVHQFKPIVEGFHGSKTLWESVRGYETYWAVLGGFLKNYSL